MEIDDLSQYEGSIYKITIHIATLCGLRPVYPISEVVLTATFADAVIYESEATGMAENLAFEQDIHLELDAASEDMMTKYTTNPIIFTLIEHPSDAMDDVSIHEMGRVGQVLWRSEESVLDLEEALYGSRTDLKDEKQLKAKKSKTPAAAKEKKGKEKPKQDSTPALKSFEPPEVTGPQVAGVAQVDLTPLFFNGPFILESLVLKAPAGKPLDDRLRSISQLPLLQVKVTIDRPLPSATIIYTTIESVYNIPSVMSNDMTYQIALCIPRCTTTFRYSGSICFEHAQFSNAPKERSSFKKSFGSNSHSQFMLRDDFSNVQSNLALDLSEALPLDYPRVQFNQVKGELLSHDDLNAMKAQLKKYRCLGLELYVTKSSASQAFKHSKGTGRRSEKDSKLSVGSTTTADKTSINGVPPGGDYLHLMAFVDLCRLLCPGQKAARVACQLRTFNQQEFEKECGLTGSYFRPTQASSPEHIESNVEVKAANGHKGKKKGESASRETEISKEAKGGGKGKKKSEGGSDLRAKLPPPPAEPIPSQLVYNEDGYPCFVIVELELREAMVKPHDEADLHCQLEEIIARLPVVVEPRGFSSKNDSKEKFKNAVMAIVEDLKQMYTAYSITNSDDSNVEDFVAYIRKQDVYSSYIATLTKFASLYCTMAKPLESANAFDEYQEYLGEAYVDLVQLIHELLNAIHLSDLKPPVSIDPRSGDDLLFFAKEAAALRATALASRYYLQRIANNDNDADCWLDYATFKLETQDVDAALECASEALRQNHSHRDALLVFACLQARHMKYAEAETCLLNVTMSHPHWIIGWMALYCVYTRRKNYEGMELCIEMASNYFSDDQQQMCVDADLQWLPQTLPEKYTYRSVSYLISKRLLDEAEIVLAIEACRVDTDILQYVLAFIEHLRGEYEHALDHIDASFRLGTCSAAKNALRGHIYAQMGKADCALAEYEVVLATGWQDECKAAMYFVYLRAALCYSESGRNSIARTLALKACEQMGTPYSWLTAGVLYFQEGDNRSAEECLTIANTLDNVMPEIWAYLTLLNIEFGRKNEASICYSQALKNHLHNPHLISIIDAKLEQWESDVPVNKE